LEIASRGSVMPTVGGEGSMCFFASAVSLIMGIFNFNAAHVRTWRGDVFLEIASRGSVMPTVGDAFGGGTAGRGRGFMVMAIRILTNSAATYSGATHSVAAQFLHGCGNGCCIWLTDVALISRCEMFS
jgi:hypothetical protein